MQGLETRSYEGRLKELVMSTLENRHLQDGMIATFQVPKGVAMWKWGRYIISYNG